MGLLTREQLLAMDFAGIGHSVFISDKAIFEGCRRFTSGSGKINQCDDYNIASQVFLKSSSDDHPIAKMTNRVPPVRYKARQHALVTLKQHVVVGCGSMTLAGVAMFTCAGDNS